MTIFYEIKFSSFMDSLINFDPSFIIFVLNTDSSTPSICLGLRVVIHFVVYLKTRWCQFRSKIISFAKKICLAKLATVCLFSCFSRSCVLCEPIERMIEFCAATKLTHLPCFAFRPKVLKATIVSLLNILSG